MSVRLTQYSHGAGCGCKIAPQVLDEILKIEPGQAPDPRLLVGNLSRDDAAVYELSNGTALISTVDFFTPIVDDPFDFGRIAAANALSDIYAMGGKPLLAIAVLGWPVEKLAPEIARRTIEGGRAVCKLANIPLAGGHSIDSAEPIFGLSVNGLVEKNNLKKNNTAGEGDLLYLTKPLGVGILSTAMKRGLLKEEHMAPMIEQMASLNRIGEELGKIAEITAMTDVTGFGLLGHLLEMAEGSGLSAEINYGRLALSAGVKEYIAQRISPDATFRNWNSYSDKVRFEKGVNVAEAFTLLPDPQTNGGILFTAKKDAASRIMELLGENGLKEFAEPIGLMIAKSEKSITVKP